MNFRGFLYFLARGIGDANAVQKGPKATQKRIGRRIVGKLTGRLIGKLFR